MTGSCPFDADFRRIVGPVLVGAIQAEAAHVAFGTYDYDVACDEVMVVACSYGAGYLSCEALTALRHWVVEEVARVLDEALPQ